MRIKKFNESTKYDKSLDFLTKEFKDMFQEVEDDGVEVNIKAFVHNGDMGKSFDSRIIEANWLGKCIKLSDRANSDIYAAFRYAFRLNSGLKNMVVNGSWLEFNKHQINEVLNVIATKEKNYDNFDFYISISGNNLVELFILTDIIIMTKDNLDKFKPLIEKGLDKETSRLNSNDSIEAGLFHGQLKGTIANLRGGNEIENPGLKRFFNNNFTLEVIDVVGKHENIIKLK